MAAIGRSRGEVYAMIHVLFFTWRISWASYKYRERQQPQLIKNRDVYRSALRESCGNTWEPPTVDIIRWRKPKPTRRMYQPRIRFIRKPDLSEQIDLVAR